MLGWVMAGGGACNALAVINEARLATTGSERYDGFALRTSTSVLQAGRHVLVLLQVAGAGGHTQSHWHSLRWLPCTRLIKMSMRSSMVTVSAWSAGRGDKESRRCGSRVKCASNLGEHKKEEEWAEECMWGVAHAQELLFGFDALHGKLQERGEKGEVWAGWVQSKGV